MTTFAQNTRPANRRQLSRFDAIRVPRANPCAAAIAKRIIANEPGARDQWMRLLKIGNSMYAIDMLKVAGVDMTTPKPIADAMGLFEQLLTELEKLLAR